MPTSRAARTTFSRDRMADPVYIQRDDVPKGGAHVVEVNPGLRIAVFDTAAGFHAINARCPHAGGSLAEGRFDGRVATCPLHRLQVDVTTGDSIERPVVNVRTFAVEEEGNRLKIVI